MVQFCFWNLNIHLWKKHPYLELGYEAFLVVASGGLLKESVEHWQWTLDMTRLYNDLEVRFY